MKAIVIGAGILGASISYQLAKRGVETTVVDRAIPGDAASAASFAWLNSNNKVLRTYHDLSVMSIAEWNLVARELGNDCWLHQVGNLHVADTPSTTQTLHERVQRLQSYGYAAVTVSARELGRLDPVVRSREEYEYAAFFPTEGYISTSVAIHDLLTAATRFGATVHPTTDVTGLLTKAGRVRGVTLGSGQHLESDVVVIAAGAGLGALLATQGIDVRTAGTAGASITTSPGASRLTTVLHLPGISIRPDIDGRIVVRSKDADQLIDLKTGHLPESAVQELFGLASERLQDFDHRTVTAERVKVAARPYLFDGLPVTGQWDELPGVYVTAMHSGVTLGAIVSRLAAEEIVTGHPSDLLEGFRPKRVAEALKAGTDYFDPYALESEPSK